MKRLLLTAATGFVFASIFSMSAAYASPVSPPYTMQQTRSAQTRIAYDAIIADAKAKKAVAVCKDFTLTFSQSRRGTCSYHKGVLVWINKPAK